MRIARRTLLAGFSGALAAPSALAQDIDYVYDELGRLIRVIYDNGATVTYSYDAAGNRTEVARTASPPSSTFTATIAITGTGTINLRTLANSAGYDGARPASVLFTLGSGVTLIGTSGAGLETGTWPITQYYVDLDLQISGKVYGRGGQGAQGASPSAALPALAGGDAIACQTPIDIVVNAGGEVKGGGGGGGGGGGWWNNITEAELGGGGGGGGFPNGAGGSAGGSTNGTPPNNGAAGTASGGGAGGSGNGNYMTRSGGAGGNGGGAGASGLSGGGAAGNPVDPWIRRNQSAGAAGGYAIRKNGHIVNVTNNGTIVGTQG
ncbi:RHS repeat domain-containing protein [Vitreimonas sp.]|uniref:RHS repeat domain-containing protein n=1 Tax=Vitreimonas sp. TaxID=3069702 RepID=UPI002EDAD6E5